MLLTNLSNAFRIGLLLLFWVPLLVGQPSGFEAITYVGTSEALWAERMTVGPDGDVYLFGTEQIDNRAAVVARVSADLSSTRYLVRLPGTGRFDIGGIAVAADGTAFVTGSVDGSLETSPDVFQPANRDSEEREGFIARVSSVGVVERVSWFPEAEINDLAVDIDGKPVLVGEARDPEFPTTLDALRPTMTPGACKRSCRPLLFSPVPGLNFSCQPDLQCSDGFLARLSADLRKLEYATFLGADPLDPTEPKEVPTQDPDWRSERIIDEGSDRATAIEVDPFGHIIVAGSTNSTQFPATSGAWQSEISGLRDLFVMKLTPDGRQVLSATLLGEDLEDDDPKLAVDDQGDWALTAVQVDPEPSSSLNPEVSDTIVAKLTDNGQRLLFRRQVGDGFGIRHSSEHETVTRIGFGADGDLLVTSPGPFSTEAYFGCVDSTFITQLDGETGDVQGAIGYPALGYEIVRAPDGAVFVGGATRSQVVAAATPGAAETVPTPGWPSAVARLEAELPRESMRVDCLANAAARAVWPRNYGGIPNPALRTDVIVSPGEILTAWGSGLGPVEPLSGQPSGASFPSELGDGRAAVGGTPAALLYAADGQVNLAPTFTPETVRTDSLQPLTRSLIELERHEESVRFWVPIETATPGVFTVDVTGVGQAVIKNEDGSWNAPNNPAVPGSEVEIFVTGLGRTAIEETHGRINGERKSATPVTGLSVELGVLPAELVDVFTDEESIAGVYRIRVRVPQLTPSSGHWVTVRNGISAASQIRATIAIGE